MKNYDYLVQMLQPEYDRDVLRRRSFKVNIRLLKSSKQFKKIIQGIVEYLTWTLETEFDDYQSNPNGGTYGVSGANLGIPYNIVAYKHNKEVKVMINPCIEKFGKAMSKTKSNCGSIKLVEKIEYERPREITVSYFDIEGKKHTVDLNVITGSYTVQHEVEHNLGILIIDKFKNEHGDWPKEYLDRLRNGEGVSLTDELDKRIVFGISWDMKVPEGTEPQKEYNWYSDECDAQREYHRRMRSEKNVKWFTLTCNLDTSVDAITKLVEDYIDGEVSL